MITTTYITQGKVLACLGCRPNFGSTFDERPILPYLRITNIVLPGLAYNEKLQFCTNLDT